MKDKHFKLREAVEAYAIDRGLLAHILFPDLAHPTRALARLLDETSDMTIGQVVAFAELVRVPLSDLVEKYYK